MVDRSERSPVFWNATLALHSFEQLLPTVAHGYFPDGLDAPQIEIGGGVLFLVEAEDPLRSLAERVVEIMLVCLRHALPLVRFTLDSQGDCIS